MLGKQTLLLELSKLAKFGGLDGNPEKADSQRAVDILSAMKDFEITLKLLEETKAGKTVKRYTKHDDTNVREAATQVIDAWKKRVQAETSKPSGGEQKSSSTLQKPSIKKLNNKTTTAQQTGQAANIRTEKAQLPKPQGHQPGPSVNGSAPGHARSQNGAAVHPVKPGDQRARIRTALTSALKLAAANVAYADVGLVAASVECALHDRHGGSCGMEYKAQAQSLVFNLKDPKNPDLREGVLRGDIEPQRLVSMKPEDMASNDQKQKNKEIKEEMTKESVRGVKQDLGTTDQFKCGRCGERKCTFFQMQTRSADEPMTTFVTCQVCNNKWKFC